MTGMFRTDWERMYSGICPKCKTYRFIGHGPLCIECLKAASNGDDQ